MKPERKELLLKDLCARLPYGVKVQIDLKSDIYPPIICKVCSIEHAEPESTFIGVETSLDTYNEFREFLCKPYLFPLSSMTDKQRLEYESLCIKEISECGDLTGFFFTKDYYYDTIESIDYLYKNHFDIHNLIPMGLAINATGLNIY